MLYLLQPRTRPREKDERSRPLLRHCLLSNLLLDAITAALSTLLLLHSLRSLSLNNRIVGWTYGSCKYYNMRMLVT